jgi:hypothetical protein
MKERDYQAKLIKAIKQRFPGCYVMKEDAGYIQGLPDLIVLYNNRWATLEVKISANAHHQPNQDYYVNDVFGKMSYASFVYPENEDKVIEELKGWFKE